ncbi:hypothetical protein V496_04677 [Pseudogymnoascus sp. VKM F-4515 (FW-2607)]|nr:hypothetical protein V496_04677 [Pseudogymnoascus sp. VKM F-4515 (FW-2607)]
MRRVCNLKLEIWTFWSKVATAHGDWDGFGSRVRSKRNINCSEYAYMHHKVLPKTSISKPRYAATLAVRAPVSTARGSRTQLRRRPAQVETLASRHLALLSKPRTPQPHTDKWMASFLAHPLFNAGLAWRNRDYTMVWPCLDIQYDPSFYVITIYSTPTR